MSSFVTGKNVSDSFEVGKQMRQIHQVRMWFAVFFRGFTFKDKSGAVIKEICGPGIKTLSISKTITLEEGEKIVGVRCRKCDSNNPFSALADLQFRVLKRVRE